MSNIKTTAADLVGRRAMSRRDLEKKLQEKGASETEARYAGEWLEAIGALDDAAYAAALAHHCGDRGYGPRRTREKLREKGVPQELWDEALDELPPDGEQIDRFLQSKLHGRSPEDKEKKRLTDALLRRGFSWGEGRSFVAGADIGEQLPLDVAGGRKWGQRGSALMRRIEKLEIPTIAAVNGFALGGGCELAMSCDIILAAGPNAEGKGGAKFGQPEVGLGITPGFSGTQRLPRRVGIAKAKELIFSGKVIGAAEAEKIGLVNAVYAPEELIPGAIAMAKSFTANAPIAVKYSKACIDRGMQMDIDDGIALENELFAMCFATADQKEGMSAFVEKRKEKHFQNK